jgi:hypothetical protein
MTAANLCQQEKSGDQIEVVKDRGEIVGMLGDAA